MEEQWDIIGLEKQIQSDFSVALPISTWLKEDDELDAEKLSLKIQDVISKHIEDKETLIGFDNMRQLEKTLMLQVVDINWRQHLSVMDHLRHSIHLRGYAQKDPKQEYKREAFMLFNDMLDAIKYQVISMLSNIEVKAKEDIDEIEQQRKRESNRKLKYEHDNFLSGQDPSFEEKPVTFVRTDKKVGRNDICPCGSNKKYKHCHGKV
jgi:preprotein translocase subunit SecA